MGNVNNINNVDPEVSTPVVASAAAPIVASTSKKHPKIPEHTEAVIAADDKFLTGVINSLVATYPGVVPPSASVQPGGPPPDPDKAKPDGEFMMAVNTIASTASDVSTAQAAVDMLAFYYGRLPT